MLFHGTQHILKVKGKGQNILKSEPLTELRNVTFHMGSHSLTWHPTEVNAPSLNPSQIGRYSIYLPRRDERLSWPRRLVYIPRWFTCPHAVTHRSTNRARRTVTLLIGSNALPLHHATNPTRKRTGESSNNLLPIASHNTSSRNLPAQFAKVARVWKRRRYTVLQSSVFRRYAVCR